MQAMLMRLTPEDALVAVLSAAMGVGLGIPLTMVIVAILGLR